MKLKTQVELEDCPFEISYQSKILTIGSCFSQEIAQKLSDLKFSVIQNPCGITFNPVSMFSCIKRCYSNDSLLGKEIIKSNNLFAHPDFHGKFNDSKEEKVIHNIESSMQTVRSAAQDIDTVIVTVGTSWVFVNKDTQKVVNNCHKLPHGQFERVLLELDMILNSLNELKKTIEKASHKRVNFIITLSPVRHLRDGLIQNQRSKARALEAIHLFTDAFENVYYFPSYEILIDELRDYRFYKDDMSHPSSLAVEYIYDLFQSKVLAQDEKKLRQQVKTLIDSFHHKPIHPESTAHLEFKKKLKEKMINLDNDQIGIDFSEEIMSL